MRARGFSLVEMLVGMAIMALVIGGFLSLLDTSAKISKAQSATAEVQENLRYVMAHLVRWTRMAGAGGLPVMVGPGNAVWVPPNSPGRPVAVEVINNVGAGVRIGGRDVLPNTDILTLRGAFTGVIKDLQTANTNPNRKGEFTYEDPDGTFKVPIEDVAGNPQDLADLEMMVDDTKSPPLWVPVVFATRSITGIALSGGRRRAIMQYGVGIVTTKDPENRSFGFRTVADLDAQAEYLSMNPVGGFPSELNAEGTVSRVAVITDHSFFIALDDDGVPTLYEHDSVADLTQPVANDIVDLQVALGCDTNGDGVATEDLGDTANDEWLFNGPGEDINDTVGGAPGADRLYAYLTEARISLATRIPVHDPRFVQPAMDPVTGAAKPYGTTTPRVALEDGRDLLQETYKDLPSMHFQHRTMVDRVKLRSLGAVRQ